jgi:hypothetical protein
MTHPAPYIPAKLSPSETPRAADYILDSYLIHHTITRCTHCNRTHESSTVNEVWCLRGHTNRNQKPAAVIRPDIPIGISTLTEKRIPVCHECYTTMPTVEATPVSEDEWRKTLQRKYAEPGPSAPKAPKAPLAIPSLDDL